MNMPNENEYFLIQVIDRQAPFDYIKVRFNWETVSQQCGCLDAHYRMQ